MLSKTVPATINIDLCQLINELSELDEEVVFEFITQLEVAMLDWEFTEKLRDYFVEECKKLKYDD